MLQYVLSFSLSEIHELIRYIWYLNSNLSTRYLHQQLLMPLLITSSMTYSITMVTLGYVIFHVVYSFNKYHLDHSGTIYTLSSRLHHMLPLWSSVQYDDFLSYMYNYKYEKIIHSILWSWLNFWLSYCHTFQLSKWVLYCPSYVSYPMCVAHHIIPLISLVSHISSTSHISSLIPFWLIIMWDCTASKMHLTQAMYVICTWDWQQNLTYVWYVAPSTQTSTLTCRYAPPTIYWLKGKRGLTSVYK